MELHNHVSFKIAQQKLWKHDFLFTDAWDKTRSISERSLLLKQSHWLVEGEKPIVYLLNEMARFSTNHLDKTEMTWNGQFLHALRIKTLSIGTAGCVGLNLLPWERKVLPKERPLPFQGARLSSCEDCVLHL